MRFANKAEYVTHTGIYFLRICIDLIDKPHQFKEEVSGIQPFLYIDLTSCQDAVFVINFVIPWNDNFVRFNGSYNVISMTTEEDLDTSLNLLKLIILNDEAAKTKLSEAWKNSQDNILRYMKFKFYGKRYEWADFCDCWYTNEYFEYIDANTVDLELFESVIDNIRKGHCPHFDSGSTENSRWTGISLIHAAAAVGNKAIIKYLLSINKHLRFCTTYGAKLPPMIIAVLKNRAAMIKYLHEEVVDLSYPDDSAICSIIKRKNFCRKWYDKKRVNLGGMVVATRSAEDRNVTIKRKVVYSASFQNPFVLIFYADVAPTESLIEAIRCYLNEKAIQNLVQYVICRRTRHEATNIVSYLSNYVAHFNADIVLECILWNGLESLSIILRKLKVEPLQYSGYSFVSIAEFLNHLECAKVLEDFCARLYGRSKTLPSLRRRCVLGQNEQQSNTGTLEPVESPFSVILKLSKQRGYDSQSTCKLLLKICPKRYDINCKSKYGMTPVHLCLESKRSAKCLKPILETLLSQGADANMQDINGRSALYLTLTPYNSPLGYESDRRHHVISTMKSVLYHNAIPKYTKTAIHHAISRDKMNSFLRYINDSFVTVILTKNSETAKGVIAETIEDKFLALSFVAILIELGFTMEKSVIPLLTDLPSELKQYINETICMPSSLQSSCRNVIRKAFPGPQLQRFLDVVHIPDAIADLVLFKPYLLRTKICLPSGRTILILYMRYDRVNLSRGSLFAIMSRPD